MDNAAAGQLSEAVSVLIKDAGYPAIKARTMELLFNCAIHTLEHAERELALKWPDFCKKKGSIRHSPLKSKKGKVFRPDENAITNEVGEHVSMYIKRLPAGHVWREVDFRFERPLYSVDLAGSNQKRLDMRFEWRFPGGPELVLEAKPLFDAADINGRYLADEGVGRFTREIEPYTREHIGAMLGYVDATESTKWSSEIKQALDVHESCQVIRFVNGAPWKSTLPSTKHARKGNSKPIWLLHMLLQHPKPLPKLSSSTKK